MGIVVATSVCVLPNHPVDAASLINFEPVDGKFPDGSVAVDNMPITDHFSSLGVTFGIDRNLDGLPDAGLFPRLEAVGNSDPGPGFASTKGGGFDIAAPGFEERLGSFFLRGVGSLTNDTSLLISYVLQQMLHRLKFGILMLIHQQSLNNGKFKHWELIYL